MRILLACEFYHPSVGGVQEVMRQVAEHLVARGHSVTVATSHLPERGNREINGVAIVEFKAAGSQVRGLTGAVDAYRRYVLESDHDVFMVKAAQQWTFDALLPILDRMERPKVFIPCGFSGLYDPAYRDYFGKMPEALRKFDHLIFYASDYRDINFVRDHHLSNFTILPNAASEREFGVARDPGFRRRHGIADEAFVILTVGTFTGGLKGHHELAEAFGMANFDGAPAILILNGNTIASPSQSRRLLSPRSGASFMRKSAGALRGLAAGRHPLSKHRVPISALVNWINGAAPSKKAVITDLPRTELVQAYLNSDLFAFASNIEYSPLVLYEAAAAGLPFVTVPVGNAAEIAQWTGGGVVCPAARDDRGYTRVDPAVLAEHISRLVADPALRAELGRAGHENWSRHFTWEIVTDRYEAIFKSLHDRAHS